MPGDGWKVVVCERFRSPLAVSSADASAGGGLSRGGVGRARAPSPACGCRGRRRRSAVGATDMRPFSRGERENYSDGVFGHGTPNECRPATGGHEPRWWIPLRDGATPGSRPGLPLERVSSAIGAVGVVAVSGDAASESAAWMRQQIVPAASACDGVEVNVVWLGRRRSCGSVSRRRVRSEASGCAGAGRRGSAAGPLRVDSRERAARVRSAAGRRSSASGRHPRCSLRWPVSGLSSTWCLGRRRSGGRVSRRRVRSVGVPCAGVGRRGSAAGLLRVGSRGRVTRVRSTVGRRPSGSDPHPRRASG